MSGRPLRAAALGLLVGAVVGYGIAQTATPSAEEQLEDLAAQLCDSLSGEMRITGAGMVTLAVDQAEALGFEGFELGSEVQDRCPGIYSDIIDQ